MIIYTIRNLNDEYLKVQHDGYVFTDDITMATLFKELRTAQGLSLIFTQPTQIVVYELKDIDYLPNDEYTIAKSKRLLEENKEAFEKLAK